MDYIPLVKELTIPSGSPMSVLPMCMEIFIVDDSDIERDDSFIVSLAVSDPSVAIARSSTVRITADPADGNHYES